MSCIGKFQTSQGLRTSATYYAATNIAGNLAGKALYESTLSQRFENVAGFDWSENKVSFSPYLNGLGEPSIESVLNFNNVDISPRTKEGLILIEQLVESGIVGSAMPTRELAEMQITRVNLNPRFNFVNLEVAQRDAGFYLKAKVRSSDAQRPIIKSHLTRLKFHPVVINSVDTNGQGFLNNLVDGVLNLDSLTPYQRQMLTAFKNLSEKNPTLQIVLPDETDTPIDNSFYDPKTNTIYISKDAFAAQSVDKLVQDLIHELAHSYTLSALNNPKTAEEKAFKRKMEGFYNAYVNSVLHPDFSYGFKNVEEFVAEFMSNPYFREHLESLDKNLREPQNFIQGILQALKSLFRTIFGYGAVDTQSEIEKAIQEYLDYLETLEDIPNNVTEFHLRFNQTLSSQGQEFLFRQTQAQRSEQRQSKSVFQDNELLKNFFPERKSQYASLLGRASHLFADQNLESMSQKVAEYYIGAFGLMSSINTFLNDGSIERLNDETIHKLVFEIKYHIHPEIKSNLDKLINYLKAVQEASELTPEDKKIIVRVISKSFSDQLEKTDAQGIQMEEHEEMPRLINELSNLFGKASLETTSQDKIQDYMHKAVYDAVIPVIKEGGVLQEFIDALVKRQENLKIELGDANYPNSPNYQKITRLIDTLNNANNPEKKATVIADLLANEFYSGKSDNPMLNVLEPLFKSGRPIMQLFAGYLENAQLTNESFDGVRVQIQTIKDKLDKIRPMRTLIGARVSTVSNTVTAQYYKNIIVIREFSYIENGEKKTIKKAFLNTEIDYVKFNNEFVDKKEARNQAQKALEERPANATQAEIDILSQAVEQAQKEYELFLEENTELEFTDEYYAIQDLIDKDTNGVKDDIGKRLREKLNELNSLAGTADSFKGLLGDDIIEDAAYSLKKEIESQIKELRNYFNKDGTPKQGEELEWAKRLNQYYKTLQEKQVYEQVLNADHQARFDFLKNKYLKEIAQATQEYQDALNSRITMMSTSSASLDEVEKRIKAAEEKKKEKEANYKNWARQNTQVKIKPEFYTDVFLPILEEIKLITGENNPDIKEIYDLINRITAPKKDEDAIINGKQFEDAEVKLIKKLEADIAALKESSKNKTYTEDELKQLKKLFDKLSMVRETHETIYYLNEIGTKRNTILEKYDTDGKITITNSDGKSETYTKDQVETIVEEAYADLTRALRGESPLNPSNIIFSRGLDITDAMDSLGTDIQKTKNNLRFALTQYLVNENLKDTEWYKLHHNIESPETYADTDVFGNTIAVRKSKSKPLSIWLQSYPTDPQYIETVPNGIWLGGQIRDQFKNPNYTGKIAPKAGKYVNTNFALLNQEEREIVNDYQQLFDQLNKDLPDYYALQAYELPTQIKSYWERTAPIQDLTKWQRAWASLKNPIMRFFREFTDYDTDSEFARREGLQARSGKMAPRRMFKNRNISIEDQSLNLNRLLLEFAAHSNTTKNLLDAVPTTTFFADLVAQDKDATTQKTNVNEAEKRELERFISRMFLGSGNLSLGSELWGRGVSIFNKILGLIRGSTAKSVLSYNNMRAFKQFFSQNSKTYIMLRINGIDRKEYFNAFISAMSKFQTNFNFHLGTDQNSITKTTLMYELLNVVPGSEHSSVARKGLKSKWEKYASLHTLSAAMVGYSDFVPAATVGEVFINRKYDIDGEIVTFADMFESVDGELVIASRFRDGGPKEAKIRNLTINLRNKIYDINYSASGQYWKRSKASWSEREILQVIFFLKGNWMFPSAAQYYGGSKASINAGKIHESIYFADHKVRLELASKGKIGKSIFLTSARNTREEGTVYGKARAFVKSPIFIDTLAVSVIRAFAYLGQLWLNTTLIGIAARAGGADDDWEEKLLDYIKINAALALIQGDTEFTSISNPIVKLLDNYNTYVKYPTYKVNKDGPIRRFGNFILDTTIDATVRATANKLSLIMNPSAYTDPTEEMNEYTGSGFMPKLGGKMFGTARAINVAFGGDMDKAPPKLLVALTTYFNLAPVDNMIDYGRKGKMGLAYGDVKFLAENDFQDIRRLDNEVKNLKQDIYKELQPYVNFESGQFTTEPVPKEVNDKLKKISEKAREYKEERSKLIENNPALMNDIANLKINQSANASLRTYVDLMVTNEETQIRDDQFREFIKAQKESMNFKPAVDAMKEVLREVLVDDLGGTAPKTKKSGGSSAFGGSAFGGSAFKSNSSSSSRASGKQGKGGKGGKKGKKGKN